VTGAEPRSMSMRIRSGSVVDMAGRSRVRGGFALWELPQSFPPSTEGLVATPGADGSKVRAWVWLRWGVCWSASASLMCSQG
jgi:hypothetical protein